ncbi:hypothetical protein HanRHA438_Chr05g0230321 [Helianthus annuus]|nr:hypothetical protein HanRHA438_Chr05g0230321 [Helianthus annuus]
MLLSVCYNSIRLSNDDGLWPRLVVCTESLYLSRFQHIWLRFFVVPYPTRPDTQYTRFTRTEQLPYMLY